LNDGNWTNINSDGLLCSSENYFKGKRHGEWKKYYGDGKIKEISKYENGKLVKRDEFQEDIEVNETGLLKSKFNESLKKPEYYEDEESSDEDE